MNIELVLRLILPIVALAIFLLAAMVFRVPIAIRQKALLTGVLTGIIAVPIDITGINLNLWHYNLRYLFYGSPVDFAITLAIVYGGVVLMIFWWLREYHPRWVVPYIVLLPFFGVFRDYVWTSFATFLAWDSSYWWIGDLLAWMIILWVPMFVFSRITGPQKERMK